MAGLGLAVSLLLTGCGSSSTSAGTSSGVVVAAGQHLSVGEFATLTKAPAVVVLDVRTPAEFATGHLQGAVDLDIRSADFATKLAGLDKAATYAVYCHSGNRSATALNQMSAAGFTHAADLAGGITAWTGDGRPVVTG
jgi:rhodanese-related sulfurtransferase